jgi:hypothetical protein
MCDGFETIGWRKQFSLTAIDAMTRSATAPFIGSVPGMTALLENTTRQPCGARAGR